MNEYKQIGKETAKQTQKLENKKPDYTAPLLGSLLWVVAIIALLVAHMQGAAIAVAVVGGFLAITALIYMPMRSSISGAWVFFIPLTGLIARLSQISTCGKLRRAGIYRPDKPTDTIPAHTSHEHGATVVRFDGSGEAGMSPDHLAKILTENARVWGARSFAIVEDDERPGRYTVTLYKMATAPSTLDDAIVGVVS